MPFPINKQLQEASKYANNRIAELNREWGNVWVEEDLAHLGTTPYDDSYYNDLEEVRKTRYLQYAVKYLESINS